MANVIGTKDQLKTFTDAVDQAEGLPKPPDYVTPGAYVQMEWTPSEEQPNPPAGWSVRYYGDPVELVDGRWAITNVEPQHLQYAGGLEQADEIERKPLEGQP